MGFILDIGFTIVVAVITWIVDTIIQIVEVIIHLIMALLGLLPGFTQVIEYFEVFNFPLFDNIDKKNPLLNVILSSVIEDVDIAKNLLYSIAFSSLKINLREYMDFIDDGNYYEGFPTIESHILIIDYTELADALTTLNGAPSTPENSYLRGLSDADWVAYWLQENKEYDVGANAMGEGSASTSTTATTPAVDTFQVIPSLNHFDVNITSATSTADSFSADQRWQVDLSDITYNPTSDTFTFTVYNDAGTILTLPYTVPARPLQLHYVSWYYIDSNPSRQYLFVYMVGAGTYPDLDVVENAIAMDGTILEAIPDVPLRLSNANYTTFGTTKAQQIEDLLDLAGIDAEIALDAILTDVDLAPGDLDHIYIKFGIKLWDTSQVGMNYLFDLCQNLFPAQGVTQGDYNATPTQDDKPTNTIIVTSEDSKYVFQFNYLTFTHTSLADINLNTGSTENGIYYSDLSKFDADGLLVYPYYSSSGKGTYNVGYLADDLNEVQDFLDGNGIVNPGTTSTEAATWLQTTTRLSYNNPSPVLQDPDGTVSDIIYLTPDRVYENNGSGILRAVNSAESETTDGQSITYYYITKSGLDAYTMAAPIGALNVIDGDTGFFRTVKFNLAAKAEIMAPFIYTFIKHLPNRAVSELFVAGAHASIYVAHYEVIEHSPMGFFEALVIIIIIVIIVIITYGTATKFIGKLIAAYVSAAVAGGIAGFIAGSIAVASILVPVLIKAVVVQLIIQEIITAVAEDNETLALIIGLVAAVAIGSYDSGGSLDLAAGTFEFGSFNSLGDLSALDVGKIAISFFQSYNTVKTVKLENVEEQLQLDLKEFERTSAIKDVALKAELDAIGKVRDSLRAGNQISSSALITTAKRGSLRAIYPEHLYSINDGYASAALVNYEFSLLIGIKVNPGESSFT